MGTLRMRPGAWLGRRPGRGTLTLGLLGVAVAALPAGAQERAGPAARGGPVVEFHGSGGDRLPFSEAVRVGHVLYLSGQIGVDPETGELVPGGIGPETRQTLENIRATLERYGSSVDRVVRCTAMLADMEEWPAMNVVWAQFFSEPRPARSAFGATALALGARLEVECTAVVGPAGAPGQDAEGQGAEGPGAGRGTRGQGAGR